MEENNFRMLDRGEIAAQVDRIPISSAPEGDFQSAPSKQRRIEDASSPVPSNPAALTPSQKIMTQKTIYTFTYSSSTCPKITMYFTNPNHANAELWKRACVAVELAGGEADDAVDHVVNVDGMYRMRSSLA